MLVGKMTFTFGIYDTFHVRGKYDDYLIVLTWWGLTGSVYLFYPIYTGGTKKFRHHEPALLAK
jgi:hypothetical protein